jgi:hypothetical protein
MVLWKGYLRGKHGAIPKSGDAVLANNFIEADRFVPGALRMLLSGPNTLTANSQP